MGRSSLSYCSSRAHAACWGPHLVCSDKEREVLPTGMRPGEIRPGRPASGSVLLCSSQLPPWEHSNVFLLFSAPMTQALISTESHET